MPEKSQKVDSKISFEVIIRKPERARTLCPLETIETPPRGKPTKRIKEKEHIVSPSLTEEYSFEEFLGRGVSLPKSKFEVFSNTYAEGRDCKDDALNSAAADFPKHELSNADTREDKSVEILARSKFSLTKSKELKHVDMFCMESIAGISHCPEMIHIPLPDFSFNVSWLKVYSPPVFGHVPRDRLRSLLLMQIDVSDKTVIQESSALRNWNLWLKRRKNQHCDLRMKTNDQSRQLTMNQEENLRKIQEDKLMFEYAKVPIADKWRGHPAKWDTGVRLADKGMTQEYIKSKVDTEKGKLPLIEFVGVPNAIKAEKGLLCSDRLSLKSKENWENSEYRKRQAEYYSKLRKKMKPHEIEMDNIVIVGEKIQSQRYRKDKSCKLYDLPTITITELEESQTDMLFGSPIFLHYCPINRDRERDRVSVVRLVINHFEITRQTSVQENGQKVHWSLLFDTKPTGHITKQVLSVENRGNVAVRYFWKLRKSLQNTLIYPHTERKIHDPWFFFDKNPGVFLPGQKYELQFFHHSRRAGIQSETWGLKTIPSLLPEGFEIQIILTAVVKHNFTEKDLEKVECYINNCMENSQIKQIAEEAIERVKEQPLRDLEYRSFFVEEELFEYQNPKHNYNSKIVAELKDLYKQIPLKAYPEWDYNLTSMQEIIKKNMDEQKQEEFLLKLSKLAESLLRPIDPLVNSRKKYQMVYSVLCKMANLIEDDSNNLKACLSHKPTPPPPPPFYPVIHGEDYGESEENFEEVERRTFSISSLKSQRSDWSTATSVYEISSLNLAHYQQCFYVKVYHQLCNVVEQVAAIVESCKLLEHHGEIRLKFLNFE